MRFSDNGYYIERYVKCDNCGVLLYGDGMFAKIGSKEGLYCSQWCIDWAQARADGVDILAVIAGVTPPAVKNSIPHSAVFAFHSIFVFLFTLGAYKAYLRPTD